MLSVNAIGDPMSLQAVQHTGPYIPQRLKSPPEILRPQHVGKVLHLGSYGNSVNMGKVQNTEPLVY